MKLSVLQTGVQLDATYRALSQQRHQQANERTRTVQRVDAQDILNAQRNARLREPASMRSAVKRNVSTAAICLHAASVVHFVKECCHAVDVSCCCLCMCEKSQKKLSTAATCLPNVAICLLYAICYVLAHCIYACSYVITKCNHAVDV